jgi:predicted ATPase
MIETNQIRRLTAKWQSGTGWPKRLEWLKISGLRGWTGQQFKLAYPIMAVVGENGSGKSTVLQCAAAIYKSPEKTIFYKGRGFASDYFPATLWDRIENAEITYSVTQKDQNIVDKVRRLRSRWSGNAERQERQVVYIDLSRIQPVPVRTGYWRIAKNAEEEVGATLFEKNRLDRFSEIMGRNYDLSKMVTTKIDLRRPVPVLGCGGITYSGFHTGAGETMIAELLQTDIPKNSLVLIDEVETSLHPRAQRRLMRDLAERCRELELQVILTTHSPFILAELPSEARAHIIEINGHRTIVYGVSPEFAMTKMDDIPMYECDLYVEDVRSQVMLTEILVAHARSELVLSCQMIRCGTASVGQALGLMVNQHRFPRPSRVFLDGDQAESVGCVILPGEDAPERVVFEQLKKRGWLQVAKRTGREHAALADACSRAMLSQNHHTWVNSAATSLLVGGDILWQAMCAEWAANCLTADDAKKVVQPVEDALIGVNLVSATKHPIVTVAPMDANGNLRLFEQ